MGKAYIVGALITTRGEVFQALRIQAANADLIVVTSIFLVMLSSIIYLGTIFRLEAFQ